MTLVAGEMAKRTTVLYVSGEEDVSQFAYRAKRFKLPSNLDTLHIMDKANLEQIFEYAANVKPGFIIIDSLQSVHGRDMNGQFVSNSRTANYFSYQFRKLRQLHDATLILVGHETKSGEIAGDASLQHDVDVVGQLDPDDVTAAKVLTFDKNRFGKTPGQFRFMIHDDRIEEVAALPTLTYKAPEILG
jgi:DNA repair protein RadA/Sms